MRVRPDLRAFSSPIAIHFWITEHLIGLPGKSTLPR